MPKKILGQRRRAGWSGFGAKLSLSLVAGTLSLLVLEVVASQLHDPSSSILAHRIPHPVLGWSLEPNAHVTYETAEVRVPVTYNSKGWRDVEHQYVNSDGAHRILILGDSFMEAFSVPLGSSVARRLEALLAQEGRGAEVINLGVGGYGTLQEWLAFSTEGLEYQPDLVLLGFYTYNDVLDNSLALLRAAFSDTDVNVRSRPFLDPSSPTWRIISPDFPAAQKAFDKAFAGTDPSLPTPMRYVKGSALYGLLRDVRRSFAARQTATEQPGDRRDTIRIPGVYHCEETPEYAEAWRLTARIVARLAAEVEASGAELVVFSVPSHLEVEVPDAPDAACLANPPSSTRLPAILSQHGIRYVDLLPTFSQARVRGARIFGVDLHWTDEGHALAARVLGEALGSLVPPAPRANLGQGGGG